VHRADLNGGDRKSWSLPEPIGSMALREKGGAVLALRSGFHFLDFGSGEVARIVETQPDELRPRFNDGKVDRVIEMPVKKVTSVMFGGPNLDVLYVTSMAKPPLPRFPSDGVQRGSLFAIYGLGVRGVPEPRFGA